jgi:hypothetical protein
MVESSRRTSAEATGLCSILVHLTIPGTTSCDNVDHFMWQLLIGGIRSATCLSISRDFWCNYVSATGISMCSQSSTFEFLSFSALAQSNCWKAEGMCWTDVTSKKAARSELGAACVLLNDCYIQTMYSAYPTCRPPDNRMHQILVLEGSCKTRSTTMEAF